MMMSEIPLAAVSEFEEKKEGAAEVSQMSESQTNEEMSIETIQELVIQFIKEHFSKKPEYSEPLAILNG